MGKSNKNSVLCKKSAKLENTCMCKKAAICPQYEDRGLRLRPHIWPRLLENEEPTKATKLVKDEIQDTKNSKKAEEPPSQKELASDNVVDKDNVSTTSLVSTVSEETPKEVITCDEVTNKAVEKLDNVPSVATAVASPRPLLKSRFRPNLSESDQQRGRLRRISGCEASPGTPVGRIRTISGSSDDFNVSGLSHQQRRPASV